MHLEKPKWLIIWNGRILNSELILSIIKKSTKNQTWNGCLSDDSLRHCNHNHNNRAILSWKVGNFYWCSLHQTTVCPKFEQAVCSGVRSQASSNLGLRQRSAASPPRCRRWWSLSIYKRAATLASSHVVHVDLRLPTVVLMVKLATCHKNPKCT